MFKHLGPSYVRRPYHSLRNSPQACAIKATFSGYQSSNQLNNSSNMPETTEEGKNMCDSSSTRNVKISHSMYAPHTCDQNTLPDQQQIGRQGWCRRTTTLGRPVPKVLRIIVQFILGITSGHRKRTLSGVLFQYLTLGLALGFILCNIIFVNMDINNDFTKTSVVDGTVSCLFVMFWCSLGVYANGLAYRLLDNVQFQQLLRIPSKRILGVNSVLLLFVLMISGISVNNYSGLWMFDSSTCKKSSRMDVACKMHYIFRVSFSVCALVWHFLVSFVVIAACRSFTISIRQLIKSLECDSRAYESHCMGVRHAHDTNTLMQEYTWIDEEYCADMELMAMEDQTSSDNIESPSADRNGFACLSQCSSVLGHEQEESNDAPHMCGPENDVDATCFSKCGNPTPIVSPSTSKSLEELPVPSTETKISSVALKTVPLADDNNSTVISCCDSEIEQKTNFAKSDSFSSSCGDSCSKVSKRNISTLEAEDEVAAIISTPVVESTDNACKGFAALNATSSLLTNSDILYQVWKIQCGLRVFGLATQRWMLSLVSLIVMWLSINLVEWLNSSPGIFDLVNLILPLLVLPLLAATFAEVNFEGNRVVKFVAPTEERLGLLYWLQSSPLELSMYGFSLSYSTIATAGFGVLIALVSKVFLQEISADPRH